MQLAERLAAAPGEQQREVLAGFVYAVMGFADLNGEIVDPSLFRSMSGQILTGLTLTSSSIGEAVASTLEDLPVMKEMDEPDGLGWFACGAVVELIYVGWYLQGRPEAVENAYTRMADLLDAADDDLGTSLHSMLDDTVDGTLSGSAGQVGWSSLVQSCTDAARRLRHSSGA